MKKQEMVEFEKVIQALCTAFSREATDDLVEVYFKALEPLPLYAVVKAAEKVIAGAERFPTAKSLWDVAAPLIEAPKEAALPGARRHFVSELQALARDTAERVERVGFQVGMPAGVAPLGVALLHAMRMIPAQQDPRRVG